MNAATVVEPKRALAMWPGMIFGLIGLNMCIVAITVFYATRDPSVATEPDYYAKAINYEQTIVQRQTNARLGWSASPSLDGDAGTGAMSLAVTLLNKAGEPVKGASVSVVAFASARSGQRQLLTLSAVDAATGKYVSPIKINRSGVWEVRITANRGDETFTRETDLFLPGGAK